MARDAVLQPNVLTSDRKHYQITPQAGAAATRDRNWLL